MDRENPGTRIVNSTWIRSPTSGADLPQEVIPDGRDSHDVSQLDLRTATWTGYGWSSGDQVLATRWFGGIKGPAMARYIQTTATTTFMELERMYGSVLYGSMGITWQGSVVEFRQLHQPANPRVRTSPAAVRAAGRGRQVRPE